MAQTWAQLQKMTDDELIAAHDQMAGPTVVGLAYYRDEIARRTFERATAASHRLARWNMVVAVVAALAAVAAIMVPLIT